MSNDKNVIKKIDIAQQCSCYYNLNSGQYCDCAFDKDDETDPDRELSKFEKILVESLLKGGFTKEQIELKILELREQARQRQNKR